MPAPISGNGGTLTVAGNSLDIRSWSLNRSSDNQAYVSSLTLGKTHRTKGNRDATMSVSLFAPDGQIEIGSVEEGDVVAIVGTTNGVQTWAGDMIVDTLEVVVNIESGENVGMDLSLSACNSDSYQDRADV